MQPKEPIRLFLVALTDDPGHQKMFELASKATGWVRPYVNVTPNYMHRLVEMPVVPALDRALVVFLLEGTDLQSSVFEVKDNQSLLVGGRIVAPTTMFRIRTGYQAEPGKRVFMVIGENADFMTADLLPNRTYYVHVVPRFGLRHQRYGLKPVDGKELDSLEFKERLARYRWVGMTDAAESWARSNMATIESKRTEYYPDWVRKPESRRPHLAQGDGR